MKNIWFISDTHCSHKNIIKYSNRPFSSIEEMDETIINNINNKVGKNDILYHLGDVSWRSVKKFRESINCNEIHLILGNHDIYKQCIGHFITIRDYNELRINDLKIVLCHYPIAVWNKKHHGVWHLCGHSHGSFEPSTINGFSNGLCLDVGVDVHNFEPISLDEIKIIMENKKQLILENKIDVCSDNHKINE